MAKLSLFLAEIERNESIEFYPPKFTKGFFPQPERNESFSTEKNSMQHGSNEMEQRAHSLVAFVTAHEGEILFDTCCVR